MTSPSRNLGPTPRGFRINNPCLIRKTSIAWQGETEGRDGAFETFGTIEDGVRAGARNFLTHWRRGERTVRALIEHHAPPFENPTDSYVAFVAARVGVTPDSPVDLEDLRLLERLIAAVIAFECDRWQVPVETLRRGCARALGSA